MTINWLGFAAVFGVSLGVVLGLVAMFSLGITGMSRRLVAREAGGSGRAGTVVATLGFTACALVVAFGIYVIVGT